MFFVPVALALLVHGQIVGFPYSGFDDGMHYLTNPVVLEFDQLSWLDIFKTESIGYPIPITVLSYYAVYPVS
ncbi:MAG: hypothetical protein HRU17_00140 [Polyangiaceae bacterium]|nr:hypothetical protein [Polyangiaceae bacterium]